MLYWEAAVACHTGGVRPTGLTCPAWLLQACALCQETRTLESNNVVDGVWLGPQQGLMLAHTDAPFPAVMTHHMPGSVAFV